MAKIFIFQLCGILLLVCGFVRSEQVQYSECEDEDVKCKIHDVKIDPCPEAKTDDPCIVKKGMAAGLSFDYLPQFSSTNPRLRIYWANGIADLPFLGMDTDACKVTPCPVEANKNSTVNYSLNVSTKFPSKHFPIKVKLWNEKGELCCFQTDIRLTKA